jgi:hypothetical protein
MVLGGGVMTTIRLPSPSQWGHRTECSTPESIIAAFTEEVRQGIRGHAVLPHGRERCNDCDDYYRVSVEIPLTPVLLDQLMNGATGYRAHYSVSIMAGEDFNRRLVQAVAPMIVEAKSLYTDKFEAVFCQRSLLGPYSKFWYPKELTDPSAQNRLLQFTEELKIARWMNCWRTSLPPRKGLLAPVPESGSVLLNGTFVNSAGDVYEQKPERAKQLYNTGWT